VEEEVTRDAVGQEGEMKSSIIVSNQKIIWWTSSCKIFRGRLVKFIQIQYKFSQS